MVDKKTFNKYQIVVGLEVHAQLSTHSKVFARDANQYGAPSNTNTSPITLGHPGTLPKLNKQAIAYAIKMGLACQCTLARHTSFDRKNYFYPDLPKGYQIMQDKSPICQGGTVPIRVSTGARAIQLHHIHVEEDAGKSMHPEDMPETLVDLNRAGTPLIEIVTEPDIHSAEEAAAVLTEIRKLVRYLAICDGNMEEGSMRCDANVSVRLREENTLGSKVEIKNMNSIRNVQRAINHEAERQIVALEAGETIISETRTFDAVTGVTAGMRLKEELNDYRYFPEPDLSPLVITETWIEQLRASMPSLPHELHRKFTQVYQLPEYDADVLTDTQEIALYFEALCQHTSHYKAASNWVMGPIKSLLNDTNTTVDALPVRPETLATLIALVAEEQLSFAVASQQVLPRMIEQPQHPVKALVESMNLVQDSNVDRLQPLVDEVVSTFPDKVAAYRKGKKGLLGMFMGEVMKRSQGKANPKLANELLKTALNSK